MLRRSTLHGPGPPARPAIPRRGGSSPSRRAAVASGRGGGRGVGVGSERRLQYHATVPGLRHPHRVRTTHVETGPGERPQAVEHREAVAVDAAQHRTVDQRTDQFERIGVEPCSADRRRGVQFERAADHAQAVEEALRRRRRAGRSSTRSWRAASAGGGRRRGRRGSGATGRRPAARRSAPVTGR